jgi:diadenylate cyclase
LKNFFQVGLLALVVLFQPELRAALEKVGSEPLRGLKSIGGERDMAAVTKAIDEICDAASEMSRTRTGALLVIERTTRLGDIVKSGVQVDASINSYLIKNIFFNKAPLHDGAVIIRNLRICAAGCFLPLTTREDIDPNLGTRHRAAIGMSEVSDAIVIVVSEETGRISVAIDGELDAGYNYRSLKQKLLSLLTVPNTKRNQGKNRKKQQEVTTDEQ